MTAERTSEETCCGNEKAVPVLEDLVPIAAMIGAGCESCTARMVKRALRHGSPEPLIEKTLGVVAEVTAAECFATAVGAEVVDRMKQSLRAGRTALDQNHRPTDAPTCGG